MTGSIRSTQVLDVQCVLCGRVAGQVVNGIFLRDHRVRAPAVRPHAGPRCGECGGSLIFEGGESVRPATARRYHQTRQPQRGRSTLRAA